MSDKRIEKGEETWRRIVESAVAMVAESGLASLSAAKLAQRAGISKSSLFHHFKSTEDIPEAVLAALLETMLRPVTLTENDLNNVFEGKNENPSTAAAHLEQFLLHLGEAALTSHLSQRQLNRAFYAFYNESLFHERYRTIIDAYLEQTVKTLAEAIQGFKPFSEAESLDLARSVITQLDGIGLHRLMGGSEAVYRRLWANQVKALLLQAEV